MFRRPTLVRQPPIDTVTSWSMFLENDIANRQSFEDDAERFADEPLPSRDELMREAKRHAYLAQHSPYHSHEVEARLAEIYTRWAEHAS